MFQGLRLFQPESRVHKSVPGAGIIINAGIIRGRALYEEIRYLNNFLTQLQKPFKKENYQREETI